MLVIFMLLSIFSMRILLLIATTATHTCIRARSHLATTTKIFDVVNMSSEIVCIVTNVTVHTWRQKKTHCCTSLSSSTNRPKGSFTLSDGNGSLCCCHCHCRCRCKMGTQPIPWQCCCHCHWHPLQCEHPPIGFHTTHSWCQNISLLLPLPLLSLSVNEP